MPSDVQMTPLFEDDPERFKEGDSRSLMQLHVELRNCKKKLRQCQQALAMTKSMILCGDEMSEDAEKRIREALDL